MFAKYRGAIRIMDRRTLERIACRCYRIMCAQGEKWERSKTKRKGLLALSAFLALVEIELFAN